MEKIKCKHCGKKFDSDTALQQHERDKHSGEKISKKINIRKIGIYLFLALVVIGLGYGIYTLVASPSRIGPVGSTHTHQDIKMYVNGLQVDFSQAKYQLRARYVHFENGDGNVVHKHATGVTIGDLLDTLGIYFDRNCLKFDGKNYCNEENKTLKFYVNGNANDQWEKYDLQDLDKILISYGNESDEEIRNQLNSITNLACKESGKPCP